MNTLFLAARNGLKIGLKYTLLDQTRSLGRVKTSNLVLSVWNTSLDVVEGLYRVQGPYIAVTLDLGMSPKHPMRAQDGHFGRFLGLSRVLGRVTTSNLVPSGSNSPLDVAEGIYTV